MSPLEDAEELTHYFDNVKQRERTKHLSFLV